MYDKIISQSISFNDGQQYKIEKDICRTFSIFFEENGVSDSEIHHNASKQSNFLKNASSSRIGKLFQLSKSLVTSKITPMENGIDQRNNHKYIDALKTVLVAVSEDDGYCQVILYKL